MGVVWKILKFVLGALALLIVIALGVVSYDIIRVRMDVNHSSESFGVGDSIYEFRVPEGRLMWVNFSSSSNLSFCLKATLSRNQLTVEIPDQQNKSQTLENRQDLPSVLQMYSENIRECDTINIMAIGNTPQRGYFSVYYTDEKVTGSKKPTFGD